ncbi:MAG: DHA2 family efflux MFS transporter permease subunit [Halioglobus sp.]|nr:DHA2 family efflux MFS transporter permease subunit [Halioglobus sp.]
MMAAIIQIIDTTIANVALPHMQGSMSASQDKISWVLTSYIMATAIAMPLTGWLAGRIGRKRLLVISVSGFTLASMACGAAFSLQEIIVFRILQGVFGASLVPISQALLLDAFPVEKHGRAMSIWGVGVMLAPILGPTVGGWLTEYYSWRWVFYINVPFGILSLLGVIALARESPLDRERPFDLFGFFLLSVAIVSLQLLLDRGHSKYWFDSAEIVVEFILALLALYLFVVHMFTHRHPYVNPQLFRDLNFALGLVFMFLLGVIMLATMALFPPYLQTLLGYPVFEAGLVLAPRGGGTMLAMLVCSWIMERGLVSPRLLIVAGLMMIVISMAQMTQFTVDVTQSMIAWTGFFQGFGLGLIFVPLSTLAFATLAPSLRTEATAIYGLVRTIGSSLGISIVMAQLASHLQREHALLTEHITVFNPLLQNAATAQIWDIHSVRGLALLEGEVNRQALQLAYADDFQLILLMALVAIPAALLLRNPPPPPAPGPGH